MSQLPGRTSRRAENALRHAAQKTECLVQAYEARELPAVIGTLIIRLTVDDATGRVKQMRCASSHLPHWPLLPLPKRYTTASCAAACLVWSLVMLQSQSLLLQHDESD